MKKSRVAVLLAGVAVFCSSVAQAGLVSFSAGAVSTWSGSGAVVSQDVSACASFELTMSAQANSTFTITTTATNESSIIWTGYILTLDPVGDATFVEGTAGSTKFNTVEYPDLWTLEFWAPEEVPHGGVVTLQFDVSIPDGLPYTFTLTQNPIPEPATAALLGLGALVLLARRRR